MGRVIYYLRHGETDWNVEGRLQGQRDIPLNGLGRTQAMHCGEVLRDLFAREKIAAGGLDFVCSPLGRARETMELARGVLGLSVQDYRIDQRLTEITFGEWEGYTLAEMRNRDPQGMAAREHDKWSFIAPGGESYAQTATRMGEWYDSLARDTVAVAHGGTARGLMAYLGVAKPAVAPLVDVAQGVVYVFDGRTMSRYA